MNTDIRKLLKNQVELNPFNDKFSTEMFGNLVDLCVNSEDLKSLRSIIISFTNLHIFHKDFYKALAGLIKSTSSNPDTVIDLLFTVFNRNYLVNDYLLAREIKGRKDVQITELLNRTTKSFDESLGDVNIAQGLETECDALILVSNLLRHLIKEQFVPSEEFEQKSPIELSLHILLNSVVYFTLKTIYEEGVWRNGDFHFDTGTSTISVTIADHNALIFAQIGHLRLQFAALQHGMHYRKLITSKTAIGNRLLTRLQSTKKNKKIKSVSVSNGMIKVTLAKKISMNDLDSEISMLGAIRSFYPFIDVETCTDPVTNLSLLDFVVLFSMIQELFRNLEKNIDGRLESLADLALYPTKISVTEVNSYLQGLTIYSQKQVNAFLQVFVCSFNDVARIDLWKSPFLRRDDYYFFSLIALTSPVYVNVIDTWLERTGFDMKKRGRLFELYIRAELERVMNWRGFKIFFIANNVIQLNNKKEEIDLVFSIGNKVFVCEVKCIKYSTTPIEYFNSFKKLVDVAAIQVKRKMNFLKDNYRTDNSLLQLLDGKEFYPLVITNNPKFTGMDVDGTPIIDFYVLESYLGSGSISSGYYEKEKGTIKNTRLKTDYYYHTEEEMVNNIVDFIRRPAPVYRYMNQFEIELSRYTPSHFPFHVFTETCTEKSQPIADDNVGEHPFQ